MVDILMATYNGAKHIHRQLNSLLGQSYKTWHLWVQDDGSSDDTVTIVKAFRDAHPGKVTLVENHPHPKGAATNFFSLLPFAKNAYVFFCDQDDWWDEDKIEKTLALFKQAEGENGPNIPLLVHTDLRVVDEYKKEIAPSFMAYQGLKARAATLEQLLCQNNITGCTTAINQPLLQKMWPGRVPQGLLMHDWWLGLGAAAFGKIYYLPQSTMGYCQHGQNEVGAQKSRLVANTAKALSKKALMSKKVENTYFQAQAFYQAYGDKLPVRAGEVIQDYGNFPQYSKIVRMKKILFGPYKKQGFSRVVGQLVFC